MANKSSSKGKGKSGGSSSSSGKGKSGRTSGSGGSSAGNTSNQYSQTQVTTDPEEIQRWVQERGGYPATVRGTGDDDAGVLRIDYPGYSGTDTLERISWDEFFDKFKEANLAFLYQEETKDGGPSRFSKLVDRDSVQAG